MGTSRDKTTLATLWALTITLASSVALGQQASVTPRERPERIYLADDETDGRLLAFDPASGARQELLTGCSARARISPDGRLVAYERDGAIWVRALAAGGVPRQVLDLNGATARSPAVWSHDSAQLVVSAGSRDEARGHWRFDTFRVNMDGTGKEELKIPHEDGVDDWSTDGRWLLTTSSRGAAIGWQLYVMRPDGTDQRQITEGGNPFYTRFAPDGRRVLYSDGTSEERRGIWVVELASLARRRVLATGKALASACWSPDGMRISVAVFDHDPAAADPAAGRLIMINPDGSNSVEFPLHDVPDADMPDWR
jgi:dipeptidyl aminopeptidase/acylaminoacyl peptidase